MNLHSFKRLVSLAKRLYPAPGMSSNDWGHIRSVVRQGIRMTARVQGRQLIEAELAALLFHDVAVAPFGGEKQQHAERSGVCAYMLLSSVLGAEEARAVGMAISLHDTKSVEHETALADLVAAADFSPMDLKFIVQKSFRKNLEKGFSREGAAENAAQYVRKAYGTTSNRVFPRLYRAYYADAITALAKQADALTATKVHEMV